jgi:ubiquinone/menaquinone biosynthesis C-methylase UbiE
MLLVIGQWIQITGVDLSERMLGHCREKLAREPAEVQARVQLVRADLRRFDLGRKFALITIPFRPFQYLITLEGKTSWRV